jgi:putative photosynthetic complex assembly protein
MKAHSTPTPRIASPALLVAAAGLVGFVMAASFIGRSDAHGGTPPNTPVVEARLLRFTDRADGAVLVTDAANGHPVAVVTGQNGFLRCTLRGFTRFRQTNDIGRQVPFALTLFADHRLTLTDPTTNRSIELEAFGQTNEAVFARFLQPLPPQPSRPQPARRPS